MCGPASSYNLRNHHWWNIPSLYPETPVICGTSLLNIGKPSTSVEYPLLCISRPLTSVELTYSISGDPWHLWTILLYLESPHQLWNVTFPKDRTQYLWNIPSLYQEATVSVEHPFLYIQKSWYLWNISSSKSEDSKICGTFPPLYIESPKSVEHLLPYRGRNIHGTFSSLYLKTLILVEPLLP